MTLSERLRAQIVDITPRIPDHNRRALEEIAGVVSEIENAVAEHYKRRQTSEKDGA
jgi:hypothetical protein